MVYWFTVDFFYQGRLKQFNSVKEVKKVDNIIPYH